MLRAIISLKNILSTLSYTYQMYVQTNVYLNHSPWSFRLNKTPPSAQLDPSVKIHQTIHSPSQLELKIRFHTRIPHIIPKEENKNLKAYDEADQTVRLATPKYDSENAEGLFATKSVQESEHPTHVAYTDPAQSPQNLERQPQYRTRKGDGYVKSKMI
jgi:hypothetical protein